MLVIKLLLWRQRDRPWASRRGSQGSQVRRKNIPAQEIKLKLPQNILKS